MLNKNHITDRNESVGAAVQNSESEATGRVGHFEMQVGFSPPTPEAKARHERRADTLTAWLLHRWESERREATHERTRAAG